ncbi:hypothetical protein Ancab_017687 [Ancistrocladus abbreviatus]
MRGRRNGGGEAAAVIGTTTPITVTTFKPRQILLSYKQNMRQNATAAANDGGAISLTFDSKSLLLNSICQFLERNGLSKTLKKLRSEAQIESDDSRSCSLNLEEICKEYLKMRHANVDDDKKVKRQGIAGKSSEAIWEHNEGTLSFASMKNVPVKKKKTRDDGNERNFEGAGQQEHFVKMSVESLKDNLADNAKVKSKEKKKSRSADDSHGENIEESLGPGTSNVLSEGTRKLKDKKKKGELFSVSQNDSQQKQEVAPTGVTCAPGKSASDMESRKKNESEGEKQKNNEKLDSLDDSVKERSLKDKQGAIMTDLVGKERPRDSQLEITSEDADDIPLERKRVKSKGKRAKDAPASGNLSAGAMEALDQEQNINKGDLPTAEGKMEEKKGSKKRKNSSSKENQNGHVEISSKDLKRRKTDGSGEARTGELVAKVHVSLDADGELLEGENDQVNSSIFQTLSANKDADGALANNGGDKSSMQKREKRQHNGSAEPRKTNAFQRVIADDVVFADNRLEDNSYWAKDGAESGYGAKAQEVLGQVRGRDFRHEKTKKKRGSYRGGQIDLQSHSVKFNYSDDE